MIARKYMFRAVYTLSEASARKYTKRAQTGLRGIPKSIFVKSLLGHERVPNKKFFSRLGSKDGFMRKLLGPGKDYYANNVYITFLRLMSARGKMYVFAYMRAKYVCWCLSLRHDSITRTNIICASTHVYIKVPLRSCTKIKSFFLDLGQGKDLRGNFWD
jgi:hypothetical protein